MSSPLVQALIPLDLWEWLEGYREERTRTAVLIEALEQLRADERPEDLLAAARADLARAQRRLADLTSPGRRAMYVRRCRPAPDNDKRKGKMPTKTKALSMRAAAIEVLQAEGKPMTVKDIWAAIEERKLHKSSGKTPEATLAAVMIRSADFRKTAPATYKLAATK